MMEEPFRRRGLKENAAVEAAFREVGVRSGRSGEDLLGWLYRRHQETFSIEHQFAHVETALELAGVRARPVPGVEAAAFADLTGYTSLSEEAGDAAAADVSLALSQLVKETASRHRGEVVKMLRGTASTSTSATHTTPSERRSMWSGGSVRVDFLQHTSASMPGR